MTTLWTDTTKILLALTLACGVVPTAVAADEESHKGWEHEAELSLVATSGNSESTTFAFQYSLSREWEKSSFHADLSGLRAQSDTGQRIAMGTPDDFEVVDETASELTAEDFTVEGRYEHDWYKKLFWFVGGSWHRNEFAGIDSRFIVELGTGSTWWESEKSHFKTTYSVTGTRQEDVVASTDSKTFFGLRLGCDLFKHLTATTTYTNLLTVDENLDDTSDLRAVLDQSLSVSISNRLELKASLKLIYDNQPALESLPLFLPDGSAAGSVLVELDELDTTFSTALVIHF